MTKFWNGLLFIIRRTTKGGVDNIEKKSINQPQLNIKKDGGFFVYNFAFAVGDAIVTPASGGVGISLDTTSGVSCNGVNCGTFVELSGPSIAEGAPGNISAGTHTISLPTGWKFKPGSTVKVIRTAGNIFPTI